MIPTCKRSGCDRPASGDGPYCTLLCAGLSRHRRQALDALERQERRQARGAPHVVGLVLAELEELDALTAATERLYESREQRVSSWRGRG